MADQDRKEAQGASATVSSGRRRTDIFDSDEFDPIKFVNQIYPDGE